MDEELIRVLLVEDDEDDYVITRDQLLEIRGQRFHLDWVEDFEQGVLIISKAEHDVYLIDYRLGKHNGLELLRRAVGMGCRKPMILLTGQGEREIDMEAMRAGAADYLVKGEIDSNTLERSIRYAHRQARTMEVLRRAVREKSLLSSAVNNLNTGVIITNTSLPDDPIVFVNPAFCKITGYEPEEVLGRRTDFLYGPDTDPEVLARLRKAKSDGKSVTAVLRNYRKDGSTFWNELTVSPIFGEDGKVVNFVKLQNDVTHREEAESRLRASERRFRSVVESADDAIVLTNSSSMIINCNKGGQKAFGYGENEVLHIPIERLLAPSFRERFRKEIEQFQISGRFNLLNRASEWEGLRKDGSTFPIELSVGTWEAGAETFLSIIVRDITERRQNEKMRLEKEAAEESNRAKSEFLAKMSHELRTPLNSVIGFTNILLKNKPENLTPQDLSYLERILVNGKHLLKLINNVLDISKIESGKVELEIKSVSLPGLVRETLQQLEGQIPPRVELIAELPEPMAEMRTDPARLQQVLINLVANGLKFTEEGTVRLRVEVDTLTREPTLISVIDTGIGFSPDRVEKILQPFQQEDSSISRRYGGTGLGLTISCSLCQLMGYELLVRSERGKGSTFTIVLRPDPESSWSESAGKRLIGGPDLATSVWRITNKELSERLVLIVDDEPDARMLLSHYITDFGCRVMEAGNADQALKLAGRERPDLITLDLLMPRMNGWEFVKSLKLQPTLRDIPIVVVSIVASENRIVNYGRMDFLDKPVQREDLIRVLRSNLYPDLTKVLVVENNADERTIIAAYLKEEGLDVRTARNGAEALKDLESQTPDLILLDLLMPVMDGMTFLNELRSRTSFRDLPVVVITSKDLSSNEALDLSRQTSGVVRKHGEMWEDLKLTLSRLKENQEI